MPFEAYLPAAFSHIHENMMFDTLVRSLEKSCANSIVPHYLVGNVLFNGQDLDGVFLKPGTICVVELKNYGGMIHFSENSDWFADETVVQGGRQGNPFLQVRANKFKLLEYLVTRERDILNQERSVKWGHISGMVVFGKNIHFDEQLPVTISPWFHICDQRNCSTRLLGLKSGGLQLSDEELSKIIRCLELKPKHLYTGVVPAAAAFVAPGGGSPHKLRIVYHKDSLFRECQARMREAGGAKFQGAIRVMALLEEVRRGINAFAALPRTSNPRIPNSVVFTINQHSQLLALVMGSSLYPWFLGDPTEVALWIASNEGLTLTVDGGTCRINTTVVGTQPSAENLQPVAFTEEKQSLLNRVSGLDLEQIVPQALIRKLLNGLTEESSEAEIMEVLETISDTDLRSFLFDIINLLRAGEIQAAETRLKLRKGEACPVADAAGLAANAVAADANADQVIVLNELDEKELDRLLDPNRFQEWMLFLHPDQKKVAEANFDKPAVLTGVSGSGKTCILIHRARHLARKYPNERIGVLTLNRSLAHLLRNLVKQLCMDGEDKNIHVFAFYDYFRALLHELGPDKYLEQLSKLTAGSLNMQLVIRQVDQKNLANEVDTRSGETLEDTWDDFYAQQNPDIREWMGGVTKYMEEYRIDASRYLREEFTLIRSAFATTERDTGYREFDRAGRSIALQPKQREDILRLLLFYEEYMLAGGMLDVLELTQALLPLWPEIRSIPSEKRFRCLLVDEYQDFSTLDLRLLRHVAIPEENGLFIAGDPVQKIMVKRLKLSETSMERGSATHVQIKKNYRNSREILKAASTLANRYAALAKKLGEEIEPLDPELATRKTTAPIALKTNQPMKKAWELAKQCMENTKTQAWTICVATTAPEYISTEALLWHAPTDVRAEILSGDYIKKQETMVVSTLNDLKGFEFNLVIIVGCELGKFPAAGVHQEETWRDALRLYVAMTRARDLVYLLYENQPSPFIDEMGGEVIKREERLLKDYQARGAIEGVVRKMVAKSTPAISSLTAQQEHWDKWLSNTSLEILRRHFVTRIRPHYNLTQDFRGMSREAINELLEDQEHEFRRWLTSRNLSKLRARELFRYRDFGKKAFEQLSTELREHGILGFWR